MTIDLAVKTLAVFLKRPCIKGITTTRAGSQQGKTLYKQAVTGHKPEKKLQIKQGFCSSFT